MKLAAWDSDLRSLVHRIEHDEIDLQPQFQRAEIWPTHKKKKLIDSILREWSIPPVFLVVLPDSRLEVLDGQQRLAAIRDFVLGQFSVDGSIEPEDQGVSDLNGLFYLDLPVKVRRQFDLYVLRCFRITDYRPEEPSELFYRLNQPTILTAGEQRNAFFGPAREQLKALVDEFEGRGSNKASIGFSNARLAYDDIIARILYFTEKGTFAVKGTERAISQRFRDRNPFSNHIVSRISRAIESFSQARDQAQHLKLNKASTLSWLLFFIRIDNTSFNERFIVEFNSIRNSRPFENPAWEAAYVFHNRASLRVADISSVVLRDVALWMAYRLNASHQIPPGIDIQRIDWLITSTPFDFEEAVEESFDFQAWSQIR